MARREPGDGEAEPVLCDEEHDDEEEGEERSEEEEEEQEEGVDEEEEEEEELEEEDEAITDYEKLRLKTIERNNAMLASLQLPNLASSLAEAFSSELVKGGTNAKPVGGGPRRRSERLKSVRGKGSLLNDKGSSSDSEAESLSPNKRKRRDQEYEPTDEELSSEDVSSESEDEMDEQVKEALQGDSSLNGADMDDEEYSLQQALALSLGTPVEASDSPGSSKTNKKRSSVKERILKSSKLDPGDELENVRTSKSSNAKAKRKSLKMSNKRHFTEGEVDAIFSLFDERGRGRLTLDDLERVSTAHDFTWSQQELLDMIHLFNRSHTGVLDLVDFRNVAHRCNLVVSER